MNRRSKLWAELVMWVAADAYLCVWLGLSSDSFSNFPRWQADTWVVMVCLFIVVGCIRNVWRKL